MPPSSRAHARPSSVVWSLLLLAALAAPARAATFFVAPAAAGGSDSNPGTQPMSPLLTIAHALNVASDGDVIFVENGTYDEHGLDTQGKSVWLESEEGPAGTIIDGQGQGSVFTIHSGENFGTRIQGFTIQNGAAGGYYAGVYGGGININQSSPTIGDCVFTDDSASSYGGGGGIAIIDGGGTTLTGCVFRGNSGGQGGGLYVFDTDGNSGTVAVDRCVFTGNSAPRSLGGALYLFGSIALVTNCTFTDNSAAGDAGGALYASGGTLTLTGDTLTLTGDTLTGNSAAGGQGGALCLAGSSTTLTDCILWGDSAGSGQEISNIAGGTLSATYDDVQGGISATTDAANHILSADPRFIGVPTYGSDLADLRLMPGSPCLGAGVAAPYMFSDFNDTLRPSPPSLGAFDSHTLSVAKTGSDSNPGTQASPFLTIGYALRAASDDSNTGKGDTILVGDGTYDENDLATYGMAITLKSQNGPANCIIDAGGDYLVFDIDDKETPATVISGFTVQNGSYHYGGAFYIYDASPTITDCIIRNNSAGYYEGGAMYIDDGSPVITDCAFTDNVGYDGGAIYLVDDESGLTFTGCTFTGNGGPAGYGEGGAVYNDYDSSVTFNDCAFTDNLAEDGGAYYDDSYSNEYYPASFNDCVFADNTGTYGGGALYCYSEGALNILGCTFTANSVSDGDGGAVNFYGSTLTVTDSILYGDTANAGPEIYDDYGTLTASHCDIEGDTTDAGTNGNINQDPAFNSESGGYSGTEPYGLQSTSPCMGSAHETEKIVR